MQNGNEITIEDFNRIKNQLIKDTLSFNKIEEALLAEVKNENGSIDIMKFTEIVDLYNYLPVKVKKDKNQSNDFIH